MSVTDSLAALRDAARDVRLDLEVPGAVEARGVRDDLVAQVDDYLLPRLAEMDAPVLMVVGGSTGVFGVILGRPRAVRPEPVV